MIKVEKKITSICTVQNTVQYLHFFHFFFFCYGKKIARRRFRQIMPISALCSEIKSRIYWVVTKKRLHKAPLKNNNVEEILNYIFLEKRRLFDFRWKCLTCDRNFVCWAKFRFLNTKFWLNKYTVPELRFLRNYRKLTANNTTKLGN